MATTDDSLVDRVIMAIDDDETLAEDTKYVVLAALESDEALVDVSGQAPPGPARATCKPDAHAVEPSGIFLRSINVAGFRGIGADSTLELDPAPGLTVVAGRNGSGKSTYAEALEVALTSTSYRWQGRAAAWVRDWVNLHTPRPRQIRVKLTEEGVGTTTVGVDWPADSDRFEDLRTWVQRPSQKREPGPGWASAIELYRPILSYEELGNLLAAEPSKLYDALVDILGLERVTTAQKRLDAHHSRASEPNKQAKAARAQLKKHIATSTDERAQHASELLRKHVPDLDALRTLATGAVQPAAGILAQLRTLAELAVPAPAAVEAVAAELRAATDALAEMRHGAADGAGRRLELLRHAVDLQNHHGTDITCPVCGKGTLDETWRAAVEGELASEAEESKRLAEAQRRLAEQRTAAERLVSKVGQIAPAPGVLLAAFDRAASARAAWLATPTDPKALADHLTATAVELHEAVSLLRAEASAALQEREDAWAPLAIKLGAWVDLAERARQAEPQVDRLQRAKDWLRAHAEQLRNELIAPLADDARTIWAALRQESNVDLGAITLPRPGARHRYVDIVAEVDGVRTGALGVMSTGELHALALALFLPRATRPESPFRFVVLDDPIQAMDPSKIDGFAHVLASLAANRQIVVFSHDDRLPSAVRRLACGARVIEVTRGVSSTVTVADACDPTQRDLEDARALAHDQQVDATILRRVIPGLCRSAVESAARDAWFAQAHCAGYSRAQVEATWAVANTASQRIALALYGDAGHPTKGWLNKTSYRQAAFDVITRRVHDEVARDPKGVVRDVERMVGDLRAGTR